MPRRRLPSTNCDKPPVSRLQFYVRHRCHQSLCSLQKWSVSFHSTLCFLPAAHTSLRLGLWEHEQLVPGWLAERRSLLCQLYSEPPFGQGSKRWKAQCVRESSLVRKRLGLRASCTTTTASS